MAITGRIRRNAGLLVAAIAFAMVAFLFMDVFSNNFGNLGQQPGVGNVDGVEIDERVFSERFDNALNNYKQNSRTEKIDESTRNAIRQSVWDGLVQEILSKKEFEELGLDVGTEELLDLVSGSDVHPLVKQAFTDPNTGEFSAANVVNFIKNLSSLDIQQQNVWTEIETTVRKDRMSQKFQNMVSKGLYTTTAEANANYLMQNKRADVDFVLLEYFQVPDSNMSISDSEIEDYYNQHKEEFKQEESKKMEYVVFEVLPTPGDSAYTLESIKDLKSELAISEDPVDFAQLNSEVIIPAIYTAEDNLLLKMDSSILSLADGSVYGPYIEDGSYRVSRILDRKEWPDSVHARHILFQHGNNTDVAEAKIDSVMSQVQAGVPFEILAQGSEDKSNASKGGDLGYFAEGAMVKEFNDSCFYGSVGALTKVKTNFGWHLIEILDQKDFKPAIKLSTISLGIEPKEETYSRIYQTANIFQGENRTYELFDQAISDGGLNKRIAEEIGKNDAGIPGLDDSRQLIRWAFREAKEGDVSDAFTCGQHYVVATVAASREEGIAPLAQVAEKIKNTLITDKRAEVLMKQMEQALANGNDLETIASQLETTVRPTEGMTFSTPFISGIGSEPGLTGMVYNANPNSILGPVKGTRGVYIFKINNIEEAAAPEDVSLQQTQGSYYLESKIQSGLLNTLKDLGEVQDNRYLFY